MEGLKTSSVHRHLEASFKVLGMDAQNLILVLLLASIMNLIFDEGAIGFIMTLGLPGLLGVCLFLIKRNKPEGYLKDLARYYTTPGFYSAGAESDHADRQEGKIYGG